jgi:MFS family permease
LFTVGFDWQALGYVAPAIVQDFNIPNSALGPIFGAANVGFLIGAALVSMLADTIGRRPVLIGATLLLPASPFSRQARRPYRNCSCFAMARYWSAHHNCRVVLRRARRDGQVPVGAEHDLIE